MTLVPSSTGIWGEMCGYFQWIYRTMAKREPFLWQRGVRCGTQVVTHRTDESMAGWVDLLAAKLPGTGGEEALAHGVRVLRRTGREAGEHPARGLRHGRQASELREYFRDTCGLPVHLIPV